VSVCESVMCGVCECVGVSVRVGEYVCVYSVLVCVCFSACLCVCVCVCDCVCVCMCLGSRSVGGWRAGRMRGVVWLYVYL